MVKIDLASEGLKGRAADQQVEDGIRRTDVEETAPEALQVILGILARQHSARLRALVLQEFAHDMSRAAGEVKSIVNAAGGHRRDQPGRISYQKHALTGEGADQAAGRNGSGAPPQKFLPAEERQGCHLAQERRRIGPVPLATGEANLGDADTRGLFGFLVSSSNQKFVRRLPHALRTSDSGH